MRKLTLSIALATGLGLSSFAHADEAGQQVDIFKHPQCGCCAAYADLMVAAGYQVTIHNSEEVPDLTELAGIPDDYQGCHLTNVAGYSFSGHVPLETVARVLAEKPPVKAFSLPGMPMGSPGMGGQKTEPFRVLGFKDGKVGVYALE
ncbi:DUF411 domain-containing protein [Aestuariispira insulae]|uniref:Metal-binding protein n=1 Tax=Aestuariispira insulae TaxID=1461337 RepID=A0A3D9HNZ0_9PROT|nr:DUF411 domain-containing protein [Aestuariispira insulae]RED51213.1 hypothetical protein DFP90_10310 [Aestuariispira insulae]